MADLKQRVTAAIEAFVHGHCAGMSRTHPYDCFKIDSFWTMRLGKIRANIARKKWVAYGVEPAKVDSVARRHTRGRFFIFDIPEMDEPALYPRVGYEQIGILFLFAPKNEFGCHRSNHFVRVAR
jgi:hypothetical protein